MKWEKLIEFEPPSRPPGKREIKEIEDMPGAEDLRKKIRVKEAAAATKLKKKQNKKRSATAITSAATTTTPFTLAKRSRLDNTAAAKSSPTSVSAVPIKETAKARETY